MSSEDPRIIVPLDYPDAAAALRLCDRLDPGRARVKVGKELFVAAGPAVVRSLHERGFSVFLDLKFHDIPNTVTGACRSAAGLGVWMLNVHLAGGRRMLEAARAALPAHPDGPLLIGVSVLTSLEDDDLAAVGCPGGVAAQVERLAALGAECGLDGLVCSPADLPRLADRLPAGFLRVTPGVRPTGAPRADQRRVLTPAEAIAAGADYLVVGRPITAAADPAAALAAVAAEVAGAGAR